MVIGVVAEERSQRSLERIKRWRSEHPENVKEAQRRWRQRHPEIVRMMNLRWHREHPVKAKAACKRWRENNRDRVRATRNAWQAANRERISAKRRERYASVSVERRKTANNRHDERKRQLVEILGGKCLDCGCVPHLAAFEFDHVNGDKVKNVSLMLSTYSWEDILAEALKCELVCANCHRVRTARRTGKM
jgi:hypothetical protein